MNVVIDHNIEVTKIEADIHQSELKLHIKDESGKEVILTEQLTVELAENIKRTVINYLIQKK